MSSISRHIRKNAENFMIDQYYKNMTPEQYKEGINNAIKMTEERCFKTYEVELNRIAEQYNESIRNTTLVAMDTLATEMVYELGNVLECYKDEPEYLDQKIDIVQNIYETAMKAIESYATDKYKNDNSAQKEFKRKKQTIQKIFNLYGGV